MLGRPAPPAPPAAAERAVAEGDSARLGLTVLKTSFQACKTRFTAATESSPAWTWLRWARGERGGPQFLQAASNSALLT